MSTRQIKSKRMKAMNEFQKSLQVNNYKDRREARKEKFYKTYERGKEGKKVYKGRTIKEANNEHYLGGVSCFVINNEGKVLVEKRANTNINAGAYDLCSGHIDNNETPTQAMISEYVEELHRGTQEEQEQARNEASQNLIKLDELDLIFKDKEKERKFFIQFYALKTKIEKITTQKEEVEGIEWLDMEEVFEMIRQGKTKFPYDKRYEKLFDRIKEIYAEKNGKKKKNIQEK